MPLVTQNGAAIVTFDSIDPADVVYQGGIAVRASDGAMYITTADGSISAIVNPQVQIKPGQIIAPATTSTAAGGWNVASDVVLSQLSETFNGRAVIRCSANTGSDAYGPLRRKILTNYRGAAHGKFSFALRVPSNIGTGFSIALRISSDEPAADPPNTGATNHMTWTWSADQMRKGQWQIMTIDPSATADNSTRIGTAWSTTGSPDYTSIKQIELQLYMPSTGTARYFDFTDVVQGEFATPWVFIGFDGAGTDANHLEYVLRRLDKWGLKGIFSIQGQVPVATASLGYQQIVARLFECGHEISNEGLTHTNYVSSPSSLSPDVATAIANFATLGITTSNSAVGSLFTAPQEALNAMDSGLAGLATLRSLGFRSARSGDKQKNFVPSAVGPDAPFGICPFTVGTTGVDVTTAADAAKYLDSAELHGEAVMLLFHSVVASGASGTQTALSVFNAIIDDIGARVYQGRMQNSGVIPLLDSINRAKPGYGY